MDSTLKAPLGGGLTLSRVVHPNGDVVLSVTSADGAERFKETIARPDCGETDGEPASPEQASM